MVGVKAPLAGLWAQDQGLRGSSHAELPEERSHRLIWQIYRHAGLT